MKLPLFFLCFLAVTISCTSANMQSRIYTDLKKSQLKIKDFESFCRQDIELACLLSQKQKLPLDISLPILQGYTDETRTWISVVTDEDIDYWVAPAASLAEGRFVEPEMKFEGPAGLKPTTEHLKISGLDLNKDYVLLAVSTQGKVVDRRNFRALSLNAPSLRVIAASCMDDQKVDLQEKMWSQVISQQPQMLFLLGDNVYADKYIGPGPITPKHLWQRYSETFKTLKLYRAPNLIPTLAIWDDHDYGKKDGGADFELRTESLYTLKAFFPRQPEAHLKVGPGASLLFTAFDQQFFFLDDRSFNSKKTLWGQAQEDWLFENLRTSEKPAWIINGNQIFTSYHPFESYANSNPLSLDKLMLKLQKVKKPYLFLTGDRHLTEIIKIPEAKLNKKTFEITTSPIHAKVYPGSFKDYPNPDQLAGRDGAVNYMLIESTKTKTGLKADVTAYGQDDMIFFKHTLQVE